MKNYNSFHSILITKGKEEERLKKAYEILGVSFLGKSTNIQKIRAEKDSISINQIRQLQKFLSLKPKRGNRKIVLIEGGEKMTLEAQNALLKTLEEPPEYAVIVILSKSKSFLLATIVSRCAQIKLSSKSNSSIDTKVPFTLKEMLNFLETNKNYYSSKEEAIKLLTLIENNKEAVNSINLKKVWRVKKTILLTNANIRLALENIFI